MHLEFKDVITNGGKYIKYIKMLINIQDVIKMLINILDVIKMLINIQDVIKMLINIGL